MASNSRPAKMDSLSMNHGRPSFKGDVSAARRVSGGAVNAPKVGSPKRTPGGASPKR